MFGSIGMQEMMLILVLALLIFGPTKLPKVGRTIGRGMAEFRRASADLKRSIEVEVDQAERQPPPKKTESLPRAQPQEPEAGATPSADTQPPAADSAADAPESTSESAAPTAEAEPAAVAAETKAG